MTTPPEIVEGTLTGARLEEAVEVSTRAFADDPFFSYMFPDESRRGRSLAILHRVVLRRVAPLGTTRAALVDGRVAGVSLWLPPGAWPFPVRVQLAQLLGGMPAFFGSMGTLGRLRPLLKDVVKGHLKAPHWYLQLLMVDPAHQRQGLGALLQEPVLATCDREGTVAWLETQKEENLAYYARFGFRVAGEHHSPDGEVTMWSLQRDPRAGT